MMNRYFTIFAALAFCVFNESFAQEGVNSGGGKLTGSGGMVTYSIGQVFHVSKAGSGGMGHEGVQLPYEITSVGTNTLSAYKIGLKVYPNPTSDMLVLQFDNKSNIGTAYTIIDQTGRVLSIGDIKSDHTSISLVDIPPATYFILVSKNNQTIQTFQIIKK